MAPGLPLLVSGLVALLVYLLFSRFRERTRGPLPPGPRGLPLVGNVLDLPPPGVPESRHWLKHKEQYGSVSSLTLLGQRFIILHGRETISEILETNALKTASRPKLVFAGEVVGYGDLMGMMPYNRRFRLHRKLTATQMSSKSIVRFQPIQEAEVLRFLKQVSADRNTDNLQDHLNLISGSIMLRLLYNYKTKPGEKDPIVDNSNLAMKDFAHATKAGEWIVDLVPWLRHVPEWVPGAGFQKTAKIYRDHLMHSVEDPYNYVRGQMAKGQDDVSYVAGLVQDIHRQIDPEEESVISWTATSMLNAGTDTTAAVLAAFFLAMILFPGVQRRAQQEIDRVVGTARLPSFGDKASLPYIRAIVQETLRWHTLAPMGFPHQATEDMHYKGCLIPKNSLILPAIAWLTHDPEVYHDPEEFKPERFMDPWNEPAASDVVFGFGRRACPGSAIAEQTLYLSIVQSLAVFSIHKGVDEQGQEMEVEYEMLPGLISRVKPFSCGFAVRSEDHRRLIQ